MPILEILHQDDWLVAIDKPAGMLVHAGRDEEGPENIAMKCLRDQLGRQVHPVHRLDRPTSGVLLFALDRATLGLAQKAFERRRVTKTYLAVVCGEFPGNASCSTPMRNAEDGPLLEARTDFRRIRTVDAGEGLRLSLVEALPLTGRYHQIRRHLLEAGFPIVGDFRYAGEEASFELCGRLGIGTRMLLQAKTLELTHPLTGAPLRIEAAEDADIRRCVS